MYSWWQSRPAENPSNVGHCSQINDLAPVAMPQCYRQNIPGNQFLYAHSKAKCCPSATHKIFLENLVCTPTCPSAAGRYSWNIVSTRQHTATQMLAVVSILHCSFLLTESQQFDVLLPQHFALLTACCSN